MFNRFTKEARTAIVHAQETAREAHADVIDVVHVVLGVLETDGEATDVLRGMGSVPDLRRRLLQRARSNELDEEALASLGIDLDAVNRATEKTFGEGALERAGLLSRLRGRRQTHIPFTTKAKQVLELALGEAVRLGENEITDRHILLGVLRTGGPVVDILTRESEPGALRAALENPAQAR